MDLSRSESEISNIIDSFKDELLIIRCDDDSGNIDSLRGVLRFSNRAWDFLSLLQVAERTTPRMLCFGTSPMFASH